MIENKSISFKVKKEYKEAILNNISNNQMKVLLYRCLNAFIGFKTNLENALHPDVKAFLERITINFILFDGPTINFKLKAKNQAI